MITADDARALLLGMTRIRRFEAACAELYGAGKIRGFLHLYDGQEAVAVGAMRHLREDDAIVATYREHGHALARGLSPGAVLAEMYGKQEGCSRGRGGSMHLFDVRRRFYGGLAIVGAGLPIAAGLALADAMQGKRRVTACFFGEGAVAEGAFHESMNLAALWHLPVLFICENNLYAMGTALSRSEAATDLAARAAAYGARASSVDGMDVLAVSDAVRAAVDGIREQPGPVFLEMRTYRFRAHSMFDTQLYREKGEVEQWRARDPLTTFADAMKQRGLLRDDDVAAIEQACAREVQEAIAFAEAGTDEPVADLRKFVVSREVR